ncbi:hypothetical protein JZ751_013681 [Albula glossodonta]|uniref:Alpha/beta hydrolase fold-3 domain-containing protein n=1 Tax=Albula glossodonta TaxID=121402 RepID=A0A8T2NT34_9TELE|nr:hypothetical protein JZ751_013681 [Albula glossodonta]
MTSCPRTSVTEMRKDRKDLQSHSGVTGSTVTDQHFVTMMERPGSCKPHPTLCQLGKSPPSIGSPAGMKGMGKGRPCIISTGASPNLLNRELPGGNHYNAPSLGAAAAEMDNGEEGPSSRPLFPFQAITDPSASPLLAPEGCLTPLPEAYILTCEYDVLRDDGVMYATRLRKAGVNITHRHYGAGFHSALMFTIGPTKFQIAHRMTENCIAWLREDL